MFFILALAIAFLIYWWLKRTFNFWKDRGVPQVDANLPFGVIPKGLSYIYSFQETYEKFKGKSSYVGIYNLTQPMLMVIDPEVIRDFLVKDSRYFESRGQYHNEKDDPLSAHLFNIDNPKWRALRQKLTPTFTSGKMKMMFPIVSEICDRFTAVMSDKIANGETGIEMRDMFARFTTDVIGSCAFGVECNSLTDPEAEFRKMGMKSFVNPRQRSLYLILLGWPNLSRKLGFKVIHDDLTDFFTKVTRENIEYRLKSGTRRNDFIDLLIDLRNENKSNSMVDSHMSGLSMNEIAAQSFVFFVAGFETSSSTSSFTLYELAKNQPVQDKLRKHIREILQKYDGKMTYESLKDMTYLEQCINEGLRKYPALPLLTRKSTEPYRLPQADVVIPKGTRVGFPMYAIQNDSRHFPNPERFDPDRFSPEEIEKRDKFSFLPFGDGPRNCIGERFGMMQVKIGLVNMIANYRFKINPKTRPIRFAEKAVILAPVEGLYFDVEKVN